jgi:ATP-binding cassette, subfamily B, bacterial MsbA
MHFAFAACAAMEAAETPRTMARPLAPDTLPLIRRLWRDWVRPHRGAIATVLGLISIAAVANALYPVLVKHAFDLLEKKDFDTLMWSPLVVIAVTAVKGFSVWGQSILTNRFVARVEADMQTALYAHLIDADVARLQRESPATLTQRFTTDFAFIKEALTRLFTVFFRDIAMILALVAVLLWLDWKSTLVAAVVAPFVIPPIARIGKRLRRVSTATQEQIGQMAAGVSESLAGVRVAKTYRLEPYLKDRAATAFDDIRTLKIKAANARARMEPILEIGAGVAIALVIIFVGWRLKSGQTTLGDFAAYAGALLMAAQPIRTLGNLNAIVQEALAALARYFAIVDEKPEVTEKAAAPALKIAGGGVRFDDVFFKYGEQEALSGVTLTAAAGKTTALVGRSGSGKSTLLALVPRLMDPASGMVTIDGQDISDVSFASLRNAVAVVSQDVTLFDDTIRANIAFGRPDATDAEIEQAAMDAAAHVFIAAQPGGYAARVGDRGGNLSGGERQRIALARAFLRNAPILLLDEATSALDAESEDLVQAALKRLMKGRTCIVIAHRLATVRDAHRIVVLDQGRVVEEGSHASLIKRKGVYAGLHARQFREA